MQVFRISKTRHIHDLSGTGSRLNILVNPEHPDMKHVNITDVQPYIFDVRLIR